MQFPKYVSTSEKTTKVIGFVDKNDKTKQGIFVDKKGYLDEDGNIWIFSGSGKPKNSNEYPYFWINDDGEKEFSSDVPELIKKTYNVDHLVDLSLATITMDTKPNEVLFDEKEIEDINAASAVFVPYIKETDDFLKKVVKNVIISMGVDINRLKSKTEKDYALSNMRQALVNDTKMSTVYFQKWMELLKCRFSIIVDNESPDIPDALKNPLIFESDKENMCQILPSGELLEFNTNKLIEDESEGE